MTKFKCIIPIALLLAACAQTPVKHTPDVNQDEPDESQAAEQATLPNVELNSELLYQFLLSEIAVQRGEIAVAAEGAVDLARKTRDPRLAMRAAHMAVQSGQMDKAIESLKIWREADPKSVLARRMLSSVLLRVGRIDEARNEFISVLEADEEHAGQTIMQIYQMLASYPDKEAALQLMRELASLYPDAAEAHWVVAQLAHASGEEELALNEVRRARSLLADWDMAVSLEALLLQKNAPQQGLELLRHYLAKYPDAREIRLQYARALLELKHYELARDQFQQLADESPENPEMAYAIALISLQLNDLPRAEQQFEEALNKGRKDRDTVQFYLGQLGEAKNNEVEAIEHYRQVSGGEYQFAAQVRIAYLLSKRGQHAEARQQLQQIQPVDDLQQVKLVLVEAQILRSANQFAEAYHLLQHGLEKLPNHPELLYETAMMAEKNDEHEVFEKLMRKLIQIEPDHAHAYNALGYSLLERNERIPEAMELVKKAFQLAPEDSAIIDSMGWGYFLTGNYDESLKLLRQAFSLSRDPEIAAHLGEVLWMRGEKDEAKRIWQDNLKANPENTVLPAVMKRFMP
ncbi:MAG: tetratricopeptide repeat protein [Gallionella sp.]|nr:tetratricopeptide repeat protein [Gallionella sp.]